MAIVWFVPCYRTNGWNARISPIILHLLHSRSNFIICPLVATTFHLWAKQLTNWSISAVLVWAKCFPPMNLIPGRVQMSSRGAQVLRARSKPRRQVAGRCSLWSRRSDRRLRSKEEANQLSPLTPVHAEQGDAPAVVEQVRNHIVVWLSSTGSPALYYYALKMILHRRLKTQNVPM